MSSKPTDPAAHTETPWHPSEMGHQIFGGLDGKDQVAVLRGENFEADAPFLCRACNAHADLLAAARYAFDKLQTASPVVDKELGTRAKDRLRAAIAKATEPTL